MYKFKPRDFVECTVCHAVHSYNNVDCKGGDDDYTLFKRHKKSSNKALNKRLTNKIVTLIVNNNISNVEKIAIAKLYLENYYEKISSTK